MPPPDYSTAFQLKLDQISHFRRELQVEYHAEYERALVEVKDDLMEKEGPELTETMKDEIRDWFNKEKYVIKLQSLISIPTLYCIGRSRANFLNIHLMKKEVLH